MKSLFLLLSIIFISLLTSGQESYLGQYSKDQIAQVNTAISADFLSPEEKNVFLYMNLARLDGRKFVKEILIPFINASGASLDNPYVSSLIEDLNNAGNLEMLNPSKGLSQAAAYHANDMGKNGKTGHTSSDGTDTFVRIEKYAPGGYMAENCSYGYGSGLEIVMQLLIDEDVPSHGHRKSILSSNYKVAGVSIKPHTVYSFNCVTDFSDTP